MQDVVKSHDVSHHGVLETRVMALMLELANGLLGGSPILQTEMLSGMEDSFRCLMLQVTMRMVNQEMLIEEDGVERRQELDCHQVLCFCPGPCFCCWQCYDCEATAAGRYLLPGGHVEGRVGRWHWSAPGRDEEDKLFGQ